MPNKPQAHKVLPSRGHETLHGHWALAGGRVSSCMQSLGAYGRQGDEIHIRLNFRNFVKYLLFAASSPSHYMWSGRKAQSECPTAQTNVGTRRAA